MFSRRHPFLFFLLSLSGVCAAMVVLVTFIAALGFSGVRRDMLVPGAGRPAVGIVEVTGVMTDTRRAITQLKAFRDDAAIRAIVLRIDSPGGAVGPAQELYRELQKTVETKKVVASMGSVAASGGYYVAAAADGIMANPGTITGSIGVIMGYTNFRELFEKIGLSAVVIKSGRFKDIGSPVRDMTEAEKALLQEFVDKTRKQFVQAVADGRNMAYDQVDLLADGRIFTGEEAMANGLVDKLGNIEDAITWAGRLGGIEGKVPVVHARERRFTFLEALLGGPIENLLNRIVSNASPRAAYLLERP